MGLIFQSYASDGVGIDDQLMDLQPTSSSQPSFPSSGLLCWSTSRIPSFGTSWYPVSGAVPGVLTLGTVEPVLVQGAQDMEVDLTGSAAEITVVVLHPLLLLIKRMDTHRPVLKEREEVRAFGRVWPQGVLARISITEPHNPASSLNQQLGIGKGQGWQGHPGGSANLNHNRRLHLDGHRPRGSMMIEVKVPRTWVR